MIKRQIGMTKKTPKRTCPRFLRFNDTLKPYSRTATSCRRDAADLYAELGDYTAAIERYKKVADSYMDSALTRFNVKEIWLRQGLCALAMGVSLLRPSWIRTTNQGHLGFHPSVQPSFPYAYDRSHIPNHSRGKILEHTHRCFQPRRCRGKSFIKEHTHSLALTCYYRCSPTPW